MNEARGRGSRDEAVIAVQREIIKPTRDNSKQEMQEPIPDESKTTKDSNPLRDTVCVNYPAK